MSDDVHASPLAQKAEADAARAEPPGVLEARDPIGLFEAWLAEAGKSEPNDPSAMALATVDAQGMPNCRMVLLKAIDAKGFVFYTNTRSAKGRELAANPRVALTFHWKSFRRAVRVRGVVEPVTAEEADAYFASRDRAAQIGAWASNQSEAMAGPLSLEKQVAAMGLKFGVGKVPRPPQWSGYRVRPAAIEFWRSRPFRLHERLLFERAGEGWTTKRLFP